MPAVSLACLVNDLIMVNNINLLLLFYSMTETCFRMKAVEIGGVTIEKEIS